MDDDDKIRRNLVVFSAGVLLVAWLDIPVGQLVESALKAPEGWRPSSAKLWGAALVVLAYLGLRYRFSSSGKEVKEELRRMFAQNLSHVVDDYVQTSVQHGLSVGKWRDGDFGVQVAAMQDENARVLQTDVPNMQTVIRSVTHRPWRESMLVELGFSRKGTAPQLSALRRAIDFHVPLHVRAKAVATALSSALVYSEHAVNGWLPVAFALIAGWVALFKLASLLF